MRLALLSPLPPEQTGLAEHAGHLRPALNQAGVEVLTPLHGQRPLRGLAEARAWVAERDWRRIDVVHAELGRGRLTEFWVLRALAERPDSPALSASLNDPARLVWNPVHTPWSDWYAARALPGWTRRTAAGLVDPFTWGAERRLARQLDGLACASSAGALQLAQAMKLAPEKLSVIPRGVPALPARQLPPLGPIRLLYFGHVQPGEGLEDLIEALARQRLQNPDLAVQLRLTVAGLASTRLNASQQQAYLAHLQARAEQKGLAAQIRWELDIDRRDIADYLQRHHLLLLTGRTPRMPGLLGQHVPSNDWLAWAIACGRGVIAPDTSANREDIAQGIGLVFRPGDVSGLCEQIQQALADPGTLVQWASRALMLAHERSWALTGHRYVGHFQRALSHRTGHVGPQGRRTDAAAGQRESA
jgi:polysaccharide biosynthesis protein PslF